MRSTAGQATKTMRFYIENHAESAPPRQDSLTLDPTYLYSKGSGAHFLTTPLGFPKRLPDKECFAPCKKKAKKEKEEIQHRDATRQ